MDKKQNLEECIFCKLAKNNSNFLLESDHSYMVFDINPKTKGHSLVITKKHFKNLFETNDDDLKDTILLVKQTVAFLLKKYQDIKGFNYISNQEKVAKQEIFHTHIHIIPRY